MPRRNIRERVSWTDGMIADLLSCKNEAVLATKSDNPPLKPDGKRMGYMQYMQKLWIEKGYGHLNLSTQNLSDQARNTECKQSEFLTPISKTVDDDRNISLTTLNLVVNENSNVINSGVEVNVSINSINRKDSVIGEVVSVDIIDSLCAEAETMFEAISVTKGDLSIRTFTTRLRTTPNKNDIYCIDKACERLIIKYNIENISDTLLVLWYVNCVVYAVVCGWIKINDIKGMERKQRNAHKQVRTSDKSGLPACIKLIDTEIKSVRSRISKCYAELNRIKINGRLTKKTKRNRIEISKECGEISHYSLICYIEKLKKRIRYLSKKRKRKIRAEKSKTLNKEFQKDQKRVFDKFRKCIEDDPENLKPVYVEKISEKRYFDDPQKVEAFWSNLWKKEDAGNPDASWIREIEEKFAELVPHIHEGDLTINGDVGWNSIKKKKNWTAPGPDKIANFWWKKLKSAAKICVDVFCKLVNDLIELDLWTCIGQVALLPKIGEWSESNQRPITCLNTLYKWFTSILQALHNNHLKEHALLQIDQRGAIEKLSGTVNNLLIDDVVLRDARLHNRNLFCYWIDVRKAFDSVSHSWLIKMLEIHRFPKKLVETFKRILNKWTVKISIPIKDGYVDSKEISLTNGILQGDSYCPALYVLTMNVVSWVIRSSEGYTLSKTRTKITHTLYIDDLKGYAKTFSKLKQMLDLVETYMKDAGLIWNSKKCKFMALKRGKYDKCENIVLPSGTVVKCLPEDENYEFMGVPQRVKMDDTALASDLLKVVKQRAHIIWSSQLSDANKCAASNIFINSAIEYYFWAVKFTINSLQEMDIAIRDCMNVTGSKHTNLMNAVNYMPRAKGGRGLRSLEQSYKSSKIKLALKIFEETDPRMKIVKEYHERSKESNSFSILKDAQRYSSEIGLELVINDNSVSITDNDTREAIPENYQATSKTLKSKFFQERHSKVLSSEWQGVNLKQRLDDENVEDRYFSWLAKWQTCPTEVVQEFFLLFYQLLPTKEYKLFRSSEPVNDTRCRVCNASNTESVKHLISNCGGFAHSLYKVRHDNALKCFVWSLLHKLKLTHKQPTWYAQDKVAPYYENENARFWWDVPEYTGRKPEQPLPPRPDGKIIIDNESEKKIFLVEMTVPWTENRHEKYEFKKEKYRHILQTLQFENPNFKVDQITVVMDVFGGYGRDLIENIGKIFKNKTDTSFIITNMQKSVISSAAHLSRTFKIRSKYSG